MSAEYGVNFYTGFHKKYIFYFTDVWIYEDPPFFVL